MESTPRAHRRVGAATIVAFLALLLLGATRGPAQANPVVPVATGKALEVLVSKDFEVLDAREHPAHP